MKGIQQEFTGKFLACTFQNKFEQELHCHTCGRLDLLLSHYRRVTATRKKVAGINVGPIIVFEPGDKFRRR